MRPPVRTALLLGLTVAMSPVACSYRPARFAADPAVTAVSDTAPIPVPRKLDPLKEVYYTDAYVRRPIVLAMDPETPIESGDVNSLDEVPRSSWFDPPDTRPDGPPVAPLTPLGEAESGQPGLAVSDARGLRYELRRDTKERPELVSASAAVASRLLGAIGYRTPEVHVVTVAVADLKEVNDKPARLAVTALFRDGSAPTGERYRVRATRWPVGIDLGPTPVAGVRPEDPNDHVPHAERRTLRSLGLALYWMGLRRLPPFALRDVYVGDAGKGHLEHYVVAMDDAFGADAVGREAEARLGGAGKYLDENALTALLTLGLRRRRAPPVQTRWLALGEFQDVDPPETFTTSPPYEPADRLRPADAYWMGKRLAAVPAATINAALTAAHFSDPSARARAAEVMETRRARAIAWAFAQVTPADVERVEPARLMLRDQANSRKLRGLSSESYAVTFLDDHGNVVAPPIVVKVPDAAVSIPLPPGVPDYLVVRATAIHESGKAPRAVEVHVLKEVSGIRVVGVVH
jgi:hypothetical protein